MQGLIVPKTAILLPSTASDLEILSVAERWAEALSQEDYDSAYGMTAHEAYYEWTPNLMRQVIEGYGLPDPRPEGPYKVTPLKSAGGELTPRQRVERFGSPTPAGDIGEVWFDLPLNGEWSDLTGTFAIYPLEGRIVLALNEIHVF